MPEPAASTAYGPMVLLALERTFPPPQRIVDDPLAYQILPRYMQWMVKACDVKPIRQLFFYAMDRSMPGLRSGFACRKRYIDDSIQAALTTGFNSLVIFGAGLDTLAYRLPELASLKAYEVDLPENIAYKQKTLEARFGSLPAQTTLVPLNFEAQNLAEALQQAGYSFDQKSIFVWEAVTQYLSEDAVRETFQVLAQAAPGSRLIFTYVLKDFIDGENRYGQEALYQRFRVRSQVWRFGLDPQHLADFLGDYGWTLLEDVGAEEITHRYLQPAGRPESLTPIERIAYAEKVRRSPSTQ